MRRFLSFGLCGVAVFLVALTVQTSWAHFGMIIPSNDVVGKEDKKEIGLWLQFTHPFEGGPQMQLDKPEKFGVVVGDKVQNLLDTLKEKKVDGKSTWEASYKITRPGDYIFLCFRNPIGSLQKTSSSCMRQR